MIQHFVKIQIEFLVDDFQFVFVGLILELMAWTKCLSHNYIIIKSFELL